MAAAAEAFAGVPAGVTTGITGAVGLKEAVGKARLADINAAIADLEARKKLVDARIAEAAGATTEDLILAKKKLDAATELLRSAKALDARARTRARGVTRPTAGPHR